MSEEMEREREESESELTCIYCGETENECLCNADNTERFE